MNQNNDNNVTINFKYEEWELRLDSDPGWDLVVKYLQESNNNKINIEIWIFSNIPGKRKYFLERKIDTNEISWLKIIKNALTKDTIVIVKCQEVQPLKELLNNYKLISTGFITSYKDPKVFAEEIVWRDDLVLNSNEIFLLIYHDGEPLYILR